MFEATAYKGVKLKTKTGQFYINYRDEQSVPRRKLVADATTAKQALRALNEAKSKVADLKSGAIKVEVTKDRLTLDELAELYFSKRDTADNAHEHSRYKLRVSGIIGHVVIPIAYSDAEKLQLELKTVVSERTERKLSPKSINVITDSVRAMLNWAIKCDLMISDNAMTKLSKLEVDNERLRVLTPDEVGKLLADCTDAYNPDATDYKLLLLVAYTTGARPVSYLNLKLEDIDVVSRDSESDDYMRPTLVHYSSVKKGGSYSVPVSARLEKLLWRRLLDLTDESRVLNGVTCLFPSKRYPRQAIAHATVVDYLQPKMDKLFNLNLSDVRYRVTLYTIRHSSASHIVANTGDIHLASKLLNHTSLKTTMRYVKASNKAMKEAVDLF